MSTPNTSLVKWVAPTDLYENDGNYVSRIPVIPLADLTELVEGLRKQWSDTSDDNPEEINQFVCDLFAQLAQLEAHRREG